MSESNFPSRLRFKNHDTISWENMKKTKPNLPFSPEFLFIIFSIMGSLCEKSQHVVRPLFLLTFDVTIWFVSLLSRSTPMPFPDERQKERQISVQEWQTSYPYRLKFFFSKSQCRQLDLDVRVVNSLDKLCFVMFPIFHSFGSKGVMCLNVVYQIWTHNPSSWYTSLPRPLSCQKHPTYSFQLFTTNEPECSRSRSDFSVDCMDREWPNGSKHNLRFTNRKFENKSFASACSDFWVQIQNGLYIPRSLCQTLWVGIPVYGSATLPTHADSNAVNPKFWRHYSTKKVWKWHMCGGGWL